MAEELDVLTEEEAAAEAKAAEEERERQRKEADDKSIEAEWKRYCAQTWGTEAGKGGRAEGHGWRGTVLVVENDARVGLGILIALCTAGYHVFAAADGPKALGLTRTIEIDALLVASELPSLNGIDIARILRQREERAAAVGLVGPGQSNNGGEDVEAPHLPILAISEFQEDQDLRAFMEVRGSARRFFARSPLTLSSDLIMIRREWMVVSRSRCTSRRCWRQ